MTAILVGCGSPAPIAPPATATPAAPAPAAGAKLRIGWAGGITGPLAEVIGDSRAGAEQAVAEINAAGGVLGRQLELVVADTKLDPQLSRESIQRLISSDKVPAIIGDYFSPNVAASAPLAEAARVVMLSPGASEPALTTRGYKFFFRNVLAQDESVRTAAEYAFSTLKIKSFVVFAGTDSFAKANADAFVAYAQKRGIEVLGVEKYDRNTTKEFTNLLLPYRDKNPGGIFLTGGQADGGLIARQARALGMKAQIVGTNAQAKGAYWSIGGDAVAGTVVSSEWAGEAKNYEQFAEPATVTFVKAWQQRTGKLPSFDNAHGYDAVKILAAAIQAAGSADGPRIADALHAMKEYQGVCGTYKFLPNGDALLPSYIIRWDAPGQMTVLEKAPVI